MKQKPLKYTDYLESNPDQVEDMADALRKSNSSCNLTFRKTYRPYRTGKDFRKS